jgi:hypothetical protein
MLGLFFDLEDGGVFSSETSVDFHQTIWRYILEDSTLHNHRYENFKSYMKVTSRICNFKLNTLNFLFVALVPWMLSQPAQSLSVGYATNTNSSHLTGSLL